MTQRTWLGLSVAGALAALPVTRAAAQPIPVPLVTPAPPAAGGPLGEVFLRSGTRLSGSISLAQLGNGPGATLDRNAERGGYLRLLVGEEGVDIYGDEIQTVVATWQQFGELWNLARVSIVKVDGTKVSGKPGWGSSGSRVEVAKAGGEVSGYQAMRNEPGYDPGNLVLLIHFTSHVAPGQWASGARGSGRGGVMPASTEPRALGNEVFGTVTLRDGRQLRGSIRYAEWGVTANDGVGSSLPDGGGFSLTVNGRERLVQCAQVKRAMAEWVNAGSSEKPDWRIAAIRVLTRDGQEIRGRPTWKLPVSTVSIAPEDGGPLVRVSAFPLGQAFNPDDLMTKVELK